jgi:hypothetical protein
MRACYCLHDKHMYLDPMPVESSPRSRVRRRASFSRPRTSVSWLFETSKFSSSVLHHQLDPRPEEIEETYHFVLLASNVSMQLLATLSLTRPSRSAIPCRSAMALPSTFNSLRFVKQANSASQSLLHGSLRGEHTKDRVKLIIGDIKDLDATKVRNARQARQFIIGSM